jgi:hypothetical protein
VTDLIRNVFDQYTEEDWVKAVAEAKFQLSLVKPGSPDFHLAQRVLAAYRKRKVAGPCSSSRHDWSLWSRNDPYPSTRRCSRCGKEEHSL